MAITQSSTTPSAGTVSDSSAEESDTSSDTQSLPDSYEEWAEGFLSYLGAPASGPTDPRVQFLEGWEHEEAGANQDFGPDPGKTTTLVSSGQVVPDTTGTWNPTDVEFKPTIYTPLPGQGIWNTHGVSTFPTPEEGYQATETFWNFGASAPLIADLKDPGVSVNQLLQDLAKSGTYANPGTTTGAIQDADYAAAVGAEIGANETIVPNYTGSKGTPGISKVPKRSELGTIGEILTDLNTLLNPGNAKLSQSQKIEKGSVFGLLGILGEELSNNSVQAAFDPFSSIEDLVMQWMFRSFCIIGFLLVGWVGINQLTADVPSKLMRTATRPAKYAVTQGRGLQRESRLSRTAAGSQSIAQGRLAQSEQRITHEAERIGLRREEAPFSRMRAERIAKNTADREQRLRTREVRLEEETPSRVSATKARASLQRSRSYAVRGQEKRRRDAEKRKNARKDFKVEL